MQNTDTIVAVATGSGGAISIIRMSGDRAVEICDRIFEGVSGKPLAGRAGFTLHYGYIRDREKTVDDVLVSLFRAPHSYTGEDMVEISCHASRYIQQEILRLCFSKGARAAQAGEFTLRAFFNARMDLSQAEAVADIIAADSEASLRLAANQMRGGYSAEFMLLREKLLDLVALLELELDFGEEDVEFADRVQLRGLIGEIAAKIESLKKSFRLGNIVKNGIPVAIVGAPNAGKSTLLNALLNEERAIVSDIAGTTRDVIEDTINLDGVAYRFIDTAGIRRTEDRLERLGIERTLDQIAKASVVLLLADIRDETADIRSQIDQVDRLASGDDKVIGLLLNKADTVTGAEAEAKRACFATGAFPVFAISAKTKGNMDRVMRFLVDAVDREALCQGDPVVFNARHYEALELAGQSIERALAGLESGLAGDLLAQDIRETLHHLAMITGEITTDQVLGTIFGKFCIGK